MGDLGAQVAAVVDAEDGVSGFDGADGALLRGEL
jgi:hypothetical protein